MMNDARVVSDRKRDGKQKRGLRWQGALRRAAGWSRSRPSKKSQPTVPIPPTFARHPRGTFITARVVITRRQLWQIVSAEVSDRTNLRRIEKHHVTIEDIASSSTASACSISASVL
jgi:hypothetical protein